MGFSMKPPADPTTIPTPLTELSKTLAKALPSQRIAKKSNVYYTPPKRAKPTFWLILRWADQPESQKASTQALYDYTTNGLGHKATVFEIPTTSNAISQAVVETYVQAMIEQHGQSPAGLFVLHYSGHSLNWVHPDKRIDVEANWCSESNAEGKLVWFPASAITKLLVEQARSHVLISSATCHAGRLRDYVQAQVNGRVSKETGRKIDFVAASGSDQTVVEAWYTFGLIKALRAIVAHEFDGSASTINKRISEYLKAKGAVNSDSLYMNLTENSPLRVVPTPSLEVEPAPEDSGFEE